MPIPPEPGLWVDFMEAALDEGRKILPQYRLVFGRRDDRVSGHWLAHRSAPLLMDASDDLGDDLAVGFVRHDLTLWSFRLLNLTDRADQQL
jgi:hypothetical protein